MAANPMQRYPIHVSREPRNEQDDGVFRLWQFLLPASYCLLLGLKSEVYNMKLSFSIQHWKSLSWPEAVGAALDAKLAGVELWDVNGAMFEGKDRDFQC